jgi:small subunit ribosomal protein S8
MTMNDPLADMLTRIRNGQQARLAHITVPASKLLENVLAVLKEEGYIREYESEELGANKRQLLVHLKYHDGEPVIRQIKRISSPGSRQYYAASKLPRVINGLGVAIVSTSKGVMSDFQARQENVGGELLCSVF